MACSLIGVISPYCDNGRALENIIASQLYTTSLWSSAVSTGDPLLGPGFGRRLRNTHQWKLFPVRTHQTNHHRRKLSVCLRVGLFSCQSPVSRCGGAATNHVPPPRGSEDQRARAGRGVRAQRGQVWAESVSGGETASETLLPRRGAAGQGDEETTHRGGKWLLDNVSAVTDTVFRHTVKKTTQRLCYCESRLSVCINKSQKSCGKSSSAPEHGILSKPYQMNII